MGRHKPTKNPDPILKTDYKYEKRSRLKFQQKQQIKQQKQKQIKKRQQMKLIQNQVQKQLQKQIILYNSTCNKNKSICKIPKGLFKKKLGNLENNQMGFQNKEHFYIGICHANDIPDFYQIHFSAELPNTINIVRQNLQTKNQQIDRQVRQQIKQIFSTQIDSTTEKAQNNMNNSKSEYKNFDTKYKNIINQQQQYKNPYILVKANQGKQKEVVINNQSTNYFSIQALQTKQTLKITQQQQDFKTAVINGYKDYIYIENKQQQSIHQFRKIVVSHMISHEIRCRRDKANSKGFTNAKSLILTPYFGDGRQFLQLIQQQYPQYIKINEQKLSQIDEQNDFFRIGVTINDKKKTIKYFTNFNTSNIIIASPVAIKSIISSSNQNFKNISFLSSVQVLYVDRASVIYMQNWEHLISVVKCINMMPNSQNICNSIHLLRSTIPELKGKIYRQSIFFSQFNFPQINGLKLMYFHNWQGCITTKIYYNPQQLVKQTQFDIQFSKLQLKYPKDDIELRFQYFKKKYWNEINNKQQMNKIIIFTRSYLQFIKIKQFLINANASANYICENTNKSHIQSKIHGFNQNQYRILLIDQRVYYYGKCVIKKFQHIYFYSLPINSYIYFQLINQIYKQYHYVKNIVVVIFSKFDIMMLERIVGSRKGVQMVKQYCSNVSFVI